MPFQLGDFLTTVDPVEVIWFLGSFTAYFDLRLLFWFLSDNARREAEGLDGPGKLQGQINVTLPIVLAVAKILLGSVSVPLLFLERRTELSSETHHIAAAFNALYSPIAIIGVFICLGIMTLLLYLGYKKVGEEIEKEEKKRAAVLVSEEARAAYLVDQRKIWKAEALDDAKSLGVSIALTLAEERDRVTREAIKLAAQDEVAVAGERLRVSDLKTSDAKAVSGEQARVKSKDAVHAHGVAEGEAASPPHENAEPVATAGEIASAVTHGIQAVTEAIKADTAVIRDDTAEIKAATVKEES